MKNNHTPQVVRPHSSLRKVMKKVAATLVAFMAGLLCRAAATLLKVSDKLLEISFRIAGASKQEAADLAWSLTWQAVMRHTGVWDRLSEPEVQAYM